MAIGKNLLLWLAARRFTAGTNAREAVATTKQLPESLTPIMNYLGEHLRCERAVETTAWEYHRLSKELSALRRCRISLKLSQLGSELPNAMYAETLATANVLRLLRHAAALQDALIEIDAETADTVDLALGIAQYVATSRPDLTVPRVAIAARRKRSETDICFLNGLKIPVRLVKGAYADTARDIHVSEGELRARFRSCALLLLADGTDPAFATHDGSLVRWVAAEAERCGRAKQDLEFQFLKGLRPRTQRRLVKSGFRVAVYLPYGTEWREYALRRWDFFKRLRRRPTTLIAYLYL